MTSTINGHPTLLGWPSWVLGTKNQSLSTVRVPAVPALLKKIPLKKTEFLLYFLKEFQFLNQNEFSVNYIEFRSFLTEIQYKLRIFTEKWKIWNWLPADLLQICIFLLNLSKIWLKIRYLSCISVKKYEIFILLTEFYFLFKNGILEGNLPKIPLILGNSR